MKGNAGAFGCCSFHPFCLYYHLLLLLIFLCDNGFGALKTIVSFYSMVLWDYTSCVGLLLLLLSVCHWNQLSCYPALDLHSCEAAVSVDSSCVALRYTACQLLKLKQNYYLTNYIFTICGDAGILQRKRYIHRSSRRSFKHLSSDVVSYPTFFRKPQRLAYRPAGINYNNLSAPKQKELPQAFSESPCLLKSAFF